MGTLTSQVRAKHRGQIHKARFQKRSRGAPKSNPANNTQQKRQKARRSPRPKTARGRKSTKKHRAIARRQNTSLKSKKVQNNGPRPSRARAWRNRHSVLCFLAKSCFDLLHLSGKKALDLLALRIDLAGYLALQRRELSLGLGCCVIDLGFKRLLVNCKRVDLLFDGSKASFMNTS